MLRPRADAAKGVVVLNVRFEGFVDDLAGSCSDAGDRICVHGDIGMAVRRRDWYALTGAVRWW